MVEETPFVEGPLVSDLAGEAPAARKSGRFAKTAFSNMNERYIRWRTPHLSRDFEMLAFGDGGGMPIVLFPTSFGRHTQNKDFGLTDAIARYVDSGRVTIYCPDSIDLESF